MLTRRRMLFLTAGAALLGACGSSAKPGRFPVPGAELHYEVRGSGPPLLLIHGGVIDAGSFAAIVPFLAAHHTVLTYDRRGNSRSELTGPPADLRLDQQADDAVRLAGALTGEAPHVFGSSGGAIVALELAARHPGKFGTVIAHEPPVPAVLPDAVAQQARYEDVYRTYLREGTEKAFGQFQALDPGEPDPAAGGDYPADPDFADRSAVNVEFMLSREMLPFTRYRPDLAALRANPPVLGVGHYRAEVASRIVEVLAGQLGTTATEFPGDHTGYLWHPAEFAEALRAGLR